MSETNAAGLSELIARLEKATGPDRELDALIERAIDAEVIVHPDKRMEAGYVMRGPQAYLAPHYTEIIDVAMRLVPKGAGLRLDRYWLRDREAWSVVLSTGGVPSNPARQFVSEDAYSAPLALSIAALKARAAIAKIEQTAPTSALEAPR